MNYQELREAMLLLGIPEVVTVRQIRERFHDLARAHHPDYAGENAGEQMERLNQAYAVVREYADAYRLSFSEEEFFRQNDEARLLRQFADDPVWGGS